MEWSGREEALGGSSMGAICQGAVHRQPADVLLISSSHSPAGYREQACQIQQFSSSKVSQCSVLEGSSTELRSFATIRCSYAGCLLP
jgi:hypothetical protein